MPGTGFLGVIFPDDTKLYAQKHNPFVYFKSIALEPTRLAKLKPFVLADLTAELADTKSASRFIFLVPNQCDDQHGAPGCSEAVTLGAGDAFLAKTVPAIVNSPAFTERSVLFITWDNSMGHEACCGASKGGGRIPLIAVTKHAMAVRGKTPSDHYSLLATIEDGFGLPRIANAKGACCFIEDLRDREALLFYVSDHGELLGETDQHGQVYWGHGLLGRLEQRIVPMQVWASPRFIVKYPQRFAALKSCSMTPISHDHFFHSALDCLGIHSEAVDEHLSLCTQGSFSTRKEIPIDNSGAT